MYLYCSVEYLGELVYSICAAVVWWDNMFSSVVQLQCGVRQGAVLSCMLFAVYVNDMILAHVEVWSWLLL